MPRHSKVPIGSCVSTCFGVGVLVGWRVQDDIHVVRSLWQRRGAGSAHAYLNRSAIYGVVEAAVGFQVEVRRGDQGVVEACVHASPVMGEAARYLVRMDEDASRYPGQVVEMERRDIRACYGAQFIPIIEHIREAAHFQRQVDNYRAALREQSLEGDTDRRILDEEEGKGEAFWKSWSECADILWASFLKAVDEDREFDKGLNEFMSEIIAFLENIGKDPVHTADEKKEEEAKARVDHPAKISFAQVHEAEDGEGIEVQDPGFWVMNDLLGGIFKPADAHQETYETASDPGSSTQCGSVVSESVASVPVRRLGSKYYDRAFAILNVIMRTVSSAQAASVNHPVSFGSGQYSTPSRRDTNFFFVSFYVSTFVSPSPFSTTSYSLFAPSSEYNKRMRLSSQ